MKFRKTLEKIAPYKAGKSIEEIQEEYGLEKTIKLASNENPYGQSKNVLEVINKIKSTQLYPDNHCTDLRKALAKKHGIDEEMFIFGNGSVEIIQMISRILLDSEDEVITGVPTFQSYFSETVIQGANLIEVPLQKETFDLKGILDKITDKTKIIYITNPNNPTGTILSQKEIEEFLKNVPSDILVVLDEAYFEFVVSEEYGDSVKLLEKYSNICILRTLSKAYGLSGLRIGYGIASKQIIEQLEKVRVPFNVSAVAQEAGIVALQDEEFVQNCRQKNREVLEYLYSAFDKLGVSYIPSQANFIMIKIGKSGEETFQKLLENGFIVRAGFPNREEYVRVSIGSMEQMKEFVKVLEEIV